MLLFFSFFSFSLVEILAGDGNCGRTKFPRFQIFYAIVKEKRLWFTGFLRGSKIIFTLICSGCANKPTWERRGSMNSGTFIVTRTWRILSDITCRLSRLNYWTVIIIRRSSVWRNRNGDGESNVAVKIKYRSKIQRKNTRKETTVLAVLVEQRPIETNFGKF